MRIRTLWLDAYGCFLGRELPLEDGLQVIYGPNEQGKSTVRSFVGDMLFGQKRSTNQRLYDDHHELRRPWMNPESYGGRMRYVLDNGHEYDIQRIFDRNNESVQVFNRSLGRDVTGDYARQRNREPGFADEQLGVTKAVFLNTVTITHVTLEQLGNDEAMTQLREKLLSLADTAEESHSSESAISYIDARIKAIGNQQARTRPLPAARARLAELDTEHALATGVRQELEDLERRRQDIRAAMARQQQQHAAIEAERAAIERSQREQLLASAERLQEEIDLITHRCFSLSNVRDFPIEREPELQRALNVLNTARTQLRRTEMARKDVEEQLSDERHRLGELADQRVVDVSDECEQRLADLETAITRLTERLEQYDAERAAAEGRLEAAHAELARLPDFAQLAPDPVEWLGRLAAEFQQRRQASEHEQEKWEQLTAAIARLEQRQEGLDAIFAVFEDFNAEADEYKLAVRLYEEKTKELETETEKAQAQIIERDAAAPLARRWAIVSAAGAGLLAGAAYYFEEPSVFISVAFLGLVAGCFVVRLALALQGARQGRARLLNAETQRALLEKETAQKRERIEHALQVSGLGALRELEALHERFSSGQEALASYRAELETQEARVREEEASLAQHFSNLCEAFAGIGVHLEDAGGVQEAVNAGIARYQEYRDALRRVQENKDTPALLQSQSAQARTELDAAKAEERERALEVREIMRSQGFRDEARHTSALRAVRAYRTRCHQVREKQGRMHVLEENLAAYKRQLENERRDMEQQQAALERFLRSVGAESPEHWRELASQAREYREARERRTNLRDKLEALLRGETLEGLRVSLDGGGPHENVVLSGRSPEELDAAFQHTAAELDALAKEDHALHLRIAQRAAGVRPLNDIEEERANVAARAEILAEELQAAAYAAAIIEEVANDRHARIAPRLAASASAYLAEITGDIYDELLIGRDLRVSVRVPQTKELKEYPEMRLSKGTVDQIYLALRLALVEGMSRTGERLPMIMDDPFVNYDGGRLANALRVLIRIARDGQILLFTCHENMARLARESGAAVLEL